MAKINLVILFGGRSAEHEISILSAKNVLAALSAENYRVQLVAIDQKGRWWHVEPADSLLSENFTLAEHQKVERGISLQMQCGDRTFVRADGQSLGPIDVVFPVLHGPFGEDGTVQGLLKLAGLPCVGSGVLGMATGMDKEVAKQLFTVAGIKVAPYVVYKGDEARQASFAEVSSRFGLPIYVKPANMGSSIGVHRVRDERDWQPAIEDALQFDEKIIFEQGIVGRELECAVLGNEEAKASDVGEILPKDGFYSYKAKYIDEDGAALVIPADLEPNIREQIQAASLKAFRVLNYSGLARCDFFLTPKNEVIINEVNGIPGFTKISMYPKLWMHEGLTYAQLIDRLIQLAIDRHRKESELKVSYC